MKTCLLLILLAMTQSSCASTGGAATGPVAAGGYEIHAKRQMDRLEQDFRNKKISRQEYDERKQQIEKGLIIY